MTSWWSKAAHNSFIFSIPTWEWRSHFTRKKANVFPPKKLKFLLRQTMSVFFPSSYVVGYIFFVDLIWPYTSSNCSPHVQLLDGWSFSLNLIYCLLLSLCTLTVLNIWQTSRNTTLSWSGTVAFSPPATLVTVWPSSPSPPAPNLAAPALASASARKESCRDRDTLDGGSRNLTPLNLAVQPGAYWTLWILPKPYCTWSGPRQASWLPGSQTKSRKLSSPLEAASYRRSELRCKKCQSDKSRESSPLFVSVFIYNLFTLLIIYLRIDLWDIYYWNVFFFCVCWSFFKMEIKFYCCGEENQKQNFYTAKALSGLENRFKTGLTILYGI